MQRRIPQMQELKKAFKRKLEPEEIRELHELLIRWQKLEVSSQHLMDTADEILSGFGIDGYESLDKKANSYFINTGNERTPTILIDVPTRSVQVTSWGKWMKEQEQKGHQFF